MPGDFGERGKVASLLGFLRKEDTKHGGESLWKGDSDRGVKGAYLQVKISKKVVSIMWLQM